MAPVHYHKNIKRVLKLASCDQHDTIDEMVELHQMQAEQCMHKWREERDESGYMLNRAFLRRIKVELANGEQSTADMVIKRWKLKAYAEQDLAALWKALSYKYDPASQIPLLAALNRAYENADIINFVCKGTEHNFCPEEKKKKWWQTMLCIE